MANRRVSSRATERIPSYVAIYSALYSDIVSGVYPNGVLLPSETALSKKYSVSRNTLRQALTVLNEDGLIQKRQGLGNLVIYDPQAPPPMDRILNPMLHFAKEEIDAIDISYNYGSPTEIAQRKLDIRVTEMVLAANSVYFMGNRPAGHAFMQIPVRQIDALGIDEGDAECISSLITHRIFERAASANLSIRLIHAEQNITGFLKIAEHTPIIYIEEILMDADQVGIARCKFYFIPEKYEISITI